MTIEELQEENRQLKEAKDALEKKLDGTPKKEQDPYDRELLESLNTRINNLEDRLNRADAEAEAGAEPSEDPQAAPQEAEPEAQIETEDDEDDGYLI